VVEHCGGVDVDVGILYCMAVGLRSSFPSAIGEQVNRDRVVAEILMGIVAAGRDRWTVSCKKIAHHR
jgi:tetrahydromethanopterin S-methyltransferase subunit G